MKRLATWWRRIIALGLLLPLPALAQKSPTEQEKIWLGIDCNIYAADRYYLAITPSEPGEARPLDLALDNWAGLSTPVNRRDRVQLYPGRMYSFFIGCNTWTTADIHFNPPPGYTVYVSYFGFPSSTPMRSFQANQAFGQTYYLNIEVRPDDGVGRLPPGFALPPTVSPVTWAVSLGQLSGGQSAGVLRWRDTGITADLLHSLSLIYTSSNSTEVYEERFADGGIKYIDAPQMQARVYRNADPSTGYTLSFYRWYQDPGVDLDFPGATPYATYTIANPDGSWQGRVRITRVQDGKTESWTLGQNGGTLTFEQATSARKVTLASSQQTLAEPYPGDSSGTLYRRERVTVTDGTGANLASRVDRYYKGFVWAEELIREIADPDLTAAENGGTAHTGSKLTTAYTYHDTGWHVGGATTKLKSVKRPDGTWVRYDYYEDAARWGELAAVYEPWKDSSPTSPADATEANSKVTTFSYVGERSFYQDIPAGSKTTILGSSATVAETTIGQSFWFNSNYGLWIYGAAPMRTETIQAYTASGTALTTTRKVFHSTIVPRPDPSSATYIGNPDLVGKLWSQTNPDGTRVSAAHFRCDFLDHLGALTRTWDAAAATRNDTGGTFWCETYFTGASTQVSGSESLTAWQGHYLDPVYLVPNRSTRRDVLRRIDGGLVIEIDYVYTGSGNYKLVYWKKTELSEGLVANIYDSAATRTSYSRIAGRVNHETRPDGTKVEHFFNDLMQVTRSETKGVAATAGFPAQDAVNTYFTYDAAGRVTATSTTAGGLTLTTATTYDLAGLKTSATDERGLSTQFAYANGGRTVTTTHPGGATTVTDRWLDGEPKSVTGTAQPASYTEHTRNGDGTITRSTHVGPGGSTSPRWTKVTTDWAGRTIKEERPAPPGASPAVFTKQYAFNSSGQLAAVSETGLADTRHQYDTLGELEYTWLDVNGSGTLDLAGPDRVTRTRSQVLSDGGTWWRQTLNYAYNQNNDTPLLQSESRTRLVPYGGLVDDSNAGDFLAGKINGLTRTYDVFRNETVTQTLVDRPNALTTVTTNVPDSSVDSVVTTLNGRKVRDRTAQNLTYDSHYDALGRLVKTTDPRTDPNPTPARIGYHASGTGQTGQVAWREDTAGNRTTYAYESATGRLSTETDPLGKVARYAYTTRGERHRTWGDTAYPVELGFNDYGEQVTMDTYRGGTGWTGSSWPASPGTADPTTWAYDPASGTLTSKTDADNKTVAYTYNARSQLKTRTWARGVTTTYAYSATTAEQTGIDYSDSTPDLTYTYNRLGQTATVTDVTGTRTFQYSPTTTKLTQEDLGSFVGTRSVSHQYDSLGRSSYLGVGLTSSPGGEYNFTYGYDTYGRMNQVWTFNYAYLPNSNLLSSISDTSSGYTQTRTYEANRDLLDVIETKWSTTSKARFDYTNDTLGRRTAVARTGEMFARYSAAGLDTAYGYNDRSELTSEVSKLGGTATILTGRDDAYAFDSIGNRTTATHNASTSTYSSNSLNQYTQRTVAGLIDVSGLAPAAATVTVNGSATGIARQGDYWFKGHAVTNTAAPVWQSLAVASSLGGSFTRFSFVPLTPEPFSYDLDGNLLSDGRWDYTYDAENRLVSMQTRGTALSVIPNADARRLEFRNDYLGRRVQKTVRAGYNGTSYTTVLSDTKSLYNGWNLLLEFDALNSLTKTRACIWGLDWSGTLQGAGGVGGLLYQNDIAGGATMIPAYDGNGNLMALLKRSDSSGAIIAAYEYDAFGQTLAAYGSHAAGNPFRFSTKYTDTETGLVYYGLRYYSPSLGRFINRDPIEEKGGHNLYAFVSNSAVNKWDYLGMDENNPYMPNNSGGGWFAGVYYNPQAWNQFLSNVINKPGYFDGTSSVSVTGSFLSPGVPVDSGIPVFGGSDGTLQERIIAGRPLNPSGGQSVTIHPLVDPETGREIISGRNRVPTTVDSPATTNGRMPYVTLIPGAGGIPTPILSPTGVEAVWREGADLAFADGLPQALVNHYIDGSGETFVLTEAQMAEMGATINLVDSPEIRGAIARLNGNDPISVNFHITPAGAALNGTLGYFTVVGTGSLRMSGNPETPGWFFSGTMSFIDRWDFDAASHRNASAEARVAFARQYMPGRAFDVVSPAVSVLQWQADREATWSGAGQQAAARARNPILSSARPGGG